MKRKLIIAVLIVLASIVALFAIFYIKRDRCDAIACASGDNCVAPNDAIVKCEDLRANPTKTDWP